MGPAKLLQDIIDPARAVEAYRAAARLVAPRCASLSCGGSPEWRGSIRMHAVGAAASASPIAVLTFPRVCSPCSIVHVRQHVAGEAFFRLLADMARAGMLPPPDRASLEAEFSALP